MELSANGAVCLGHRLTAPYPVSYSQVSGGEKMLQKGNARAVGNQGHACPNFDTELL